MADGKGEVETGMNTSAGRTQAEIQDIMSVSVDIAILAAIILLEIINKNLSIFSEFGYSYS